MADWALSLAVAAAMSATKRSARALPSTASSPPSLHTFLRRHGQMRHCDAPYGFFILDFAIAESACKNGEN
jgi:hypothetical protein